jgi:hypothetical protein
MRLLHRILLARQSTAVVGHIAKVVLVAALCRTVEGNPAVVGAAGIVAARVAPAYCKDHIPQILRLEAMAVVVKAAGVAVNVVAVVVAAAVAAAVAAYAAAAPVPHTGVPKEAAEEDNFHTDFETHWQQLSPALPASVPWQ